MSIQPQDNSDKSSEMPPKPDHCEFGETTNTDEVFGRIDEEGPNYRNVGFWLWKKENHSILGDRAEVANALI